MADSTGAAEFDPRRYLTKLSGKDYLEVKWRLLWFRTENPNGIITTECLRAEDQFALFKATVEIPTVAGAGGAIGMGHGSEMMSDFRDFIEKAETKAIGRALAAIGYGTQFCDDFGDAEHGRLADSPVSRPQQRQQAPQNAPQRPQQVSQPQQSRQQAPAPLTPSGEGQAVTPRQLQFISSIARELGIDDEHLSLEAQSSFGQSDVNRLTRKDASVFIERLQSRRTDRISVTQELIPSSGNAGRFRN